MQNDRHNALHRLIIVEMMIYYQSKKKLAPPFLTFFVQKVQGRLTFLIEGKTRLKIAQMIERDVNNKNNISCINNPLGLPNFIATIFF